MPDWRNRWRKRVAALPPGVTPVAVAYADWQSARRATAGKRSRARHGTGLRRNPARHVRQDARLAVRASCLQAKSLGRCRGSSSNATDEVIAGGLGWPRLSQATGSRPTMSPSAAPPVPGSAPERWMQTAWRNWCIWFMTPTASAGTWNKPSAARHRADLLAARHFDNLLDKAGAAPNTQNLPR